MGKSADIYYKLDPWKIIEKGFDARKSEVSESIFSLGNEYMGLRGNFDEGYSGNTLHGSYFNGIYEVSPVENRVQYKGIIKRGHFMVNAVNWIYTTITVDGEKLDLNFSTIEKFERELDLKTGVMTRSYIWHTKSGKKIQLHFERFLNMIDEEFGYQKIEITSLEGNAEANIVIGADFNIIHQSQEEHNFWNEEKKGEESFSSAIIGKTVTTEQKVFSGFNVETNKPLSMEAVENDKFIGKKLNVQLLEDNKFILKKYVTNLADKAAIDTDDLWKIGILKNKEQIKKGYDQAKAEQAAYWNDVWDKHDIKIEGDELNQQGIRYCIFQLQQTYHGQSPSNNIGAKGLTGESYGGHAFWDTETCCLQFYLLNNLKAAKNLLEFRYHTLSQAKMRAQELDCKGACYPISTLNGHEACDLFQHASLQFQPSTGVAYGIWHYVKLSDDNDFLYGHGIEMLIEISRFLESRGDWGVNGEFGFFGVMGPDEFQMMVNHNAYTNYMAKKTFEYTLEVLDKIVEEQPDRILVLGDDLKLTSEEQEMWKKCAAKSLILSNEDDLIEQHDGFFKLPHLDIHEIPVEDFPLYHNWSYDRIYRNDMIKQPDVLMFQFLYNQDFSYKSKKVNYEYYEPKTIHESSLSPSIHSILAAELGRNQEAYDFFGFATRMDLDNYNRNTREGLHTTSIAAAWMNIVYGFAGVRTDGEMLAIAPMIPKEWDKYEFKITYKDSLISISVDRDEAHLTIFEGDSVAVKVYGETVELSSEMISKKLPSKEGE